MSETPNVGEHKTAVPQAGSSLACSLQAKTVFFYLRHANNCNFTTQGKLARAYAWVGVTERYTQGM